MSKHKKGCTGSSEATHVKVPQCWKSRVTAHLSVYAFSLILHISGPIAAALVNKFGCRPVAIAGAAFASISFFVSTFSPNIQCMILFYGFCGGK